MNWSPGAVLILIICITLVYVVALLLIEYRTLKDNIPGNHITAVTRAAIQKQPGPFIWFAFSVGYLCGHLGWW